MGCDVVCLQDQQQGGRPEKDRVIAFRSVAKIYIRYEATSGLLTTHLGGYAGILLFYVSSSP